MGKTKVGIKPKRRFVLLKRIINLMANKASLKQYYLEIGAHFLKKGCGFEVGQIIKEKALTDKIFRVSVITGLFFNFQTNEITHTAEKRIIKP